MSRKFIAIAALIVIVVIALIVFFESGPPEKKPNVVTEIGGKPVAEIFRFDQDVCPGLRTSFKNLDLGMRGLVERDQTVTVVMNWYKCNEPKVGDVVLYRYSWHEEPVLKKIVAVAGDRIDVVLDPEGRGWNLVLNGKIFESSGRRHFFGVASAAPPLKLYADANRGVLRPGLVIVLSNVSPGEKDSAWFGPIDVGDVVGRAEL